MNADDRTPVPESAGGLVLGRRQLFGLAGSLATALALAACGSSSGSPVRAVGTSSPEGTPSTGPSDSTAVTSPSASATPTTAPAARIGGAHRPGAITVSNAEREATVANGTWRGAWHDSTGHSGTSDVTIAIDGRARTARATIAFTGPLLGSPLAAQDYEIDLMSFVLLADSWTVDSPQFGTLTIVPGGDTVGGATAKAIPGHPEISSISMDALKTGRRVDLTYTIKHTVGTHVRGTVAWSANGNRATPKPIA